MELNPILAVVSKIRVIKNKIKVLRVNNYIFDLSLFSEIEINYFSELESFGIEELENALNGLMIEKRKFHSIKNK